MYASRPAGPSSFYYMVGRRLPRKIVQSASPPFGLSFSKVRRFASLHRLIFSTPSPLFIRPQQLVPRCLVLHFAYSRVRCFVPQHLILSFCYVILLQTNLRILALIAWFAIEYSTPWILTRVHPPSSGSILFVLLWPRGDSPLRTSPLTCGRLLFNISFVFEVDRLVPRRCMGFAQSLAS